MPEDKDMLILTERNDVTDKTANSPVPVIQIYYKLSKEIQVYEPIMNFQGT